MATRHELDDGRPSDLQRRLDVLAQLEETELAGEVHVDSLMKVVDPTQEKIIADQLGGLNPQHQENPALYSPNRFRVITARTRRANQGIINRMTSFGGRHTGVRGRITPR